MVLYSVTGSIFHMLALAIVNMGVGSASFREIFFLRGNRGGELYLW